MPVEFSVAAYRLGHSMVRPGYRLNDAIIEAIFPVRRETGMNFPEGLTGFRPLITDWAIDWSRFIPIEERDYGPNPDDLTKPATEKQTREMYRRLQFAYKIDTSLVDPLSSLPKIVASDPPPSLAARNLMRGAQFGLPTGQEAAKAMKLTPLPDDKILIGKAANGEKQTPIDKIANGAFKGKCPLGPIVWPRRCRTPPISQFRREARRGKFRRHNLGRSGAALSPKRSLRSSTPMNVRSSVGRRNGSRKARASA
jgi:hypothetical protein